MLATRFPSLHSPPPYQVIFDAQIISACPNDGVAMAISTARIEATSSTAVSITHISVRNLEVRVGPI